MPAKALTDAQRDERIAFLVDSHDTMHLRLELVEKQIAAMALSREKIERHLEAQEVAIAKVLLELKANTAATRETRDIVSAWRALRGTQRVLGALGKLALWLAGVGAAIAGFWALLTGRPPS